MGRLIDADAFGNRMYHEVFEKDSEDQRWDSGCWMRYKLFENVLKDQPTIDPTPHWIPVTERLPEKEGRYLVTIESGRVVEIDWGDPDIDLTKEKVFHKWDSEMWQCWEPNVIAWMPLPEPWKEVEA